jgi:hypothetical protein
LRCVLQSFDKDGSGELDQYELRELLAHLGVEEGDVGRVMEQIMLQFNAVSAGVGVVGGGRCRCRCRCFRFGPSRMLRRACCVVHAASRRTAHTTVLVLGPAGRSTNSQRHPR